ncbi:MAG: hypothetical protein SGILL_007088 [Bacillariaceae sp.]
MSSSAQPGDRQRLPSPSTVRRQYEEDELTQQQKAEQATAVVQQSLFHEYYQQQESTGDDDNQNSLSEAWDIPSMPEMKRRLDKRKNMLEETLKHRRNINTAGKQPFIKSGRNICQVLQDRRTFGNVRKNPYFTTSTNYKVGKKKQNKEDQKNTVPPQPTAFPFPASRTVEQELRTFMEYCSVTRYEAGYFQHLGGKDIGDQAAETATQPSACKAVSTISIAFAPDGHTQASTHGDHTVKITNCADGALLQELVGHPRTPWTVKYHPVDGNLVASGCLGHQVRVWHWPSGQCLQMIRLEFAIISLSFHPTGQVLAVANGTRLHFWATPVFKTGGDNDDKNENDGENSGGDSKKASALSSQQQQQKASASHSPSNRQQNNSNNNNNSDRPSPPQHPRGVLTEVEQRHMLRCVHFLPNGRSVIVGGVNPNSAQNSRRQQPRGGISGGGMSFYLRLWDFDLHASLHPSEVLNRANAKGLRRRAISNPRTFVPRALLYNDGGFDVSPDGKTLCACAEYWLPDGIENATQLMHPNYDEDSDSDGESESDKDDDQRGTLADRCNSMDMSGHGTVHSNAASPPRPPLPLSTPQSSASSRHPPQRHNSNTSLPRTSSGMTPMTPEATAQPTFPLSPPSPPGRRHAGGLGQQHQQPQPQSQSQFQTPTNQAPEQGQNPPQQQARGTIQSSAAAILPPPPGPPGVNRPPPPQVHNTGLTTPVNTGGGMASQSGRFVPHVVTISLDTTPFLETTEVEAADTPSNARGTPLTSGSSSSSPVITTTMGIPGRGAYATSQANGGSDANATRPHSRKLRPRLGQLLEACPLDGAKASAVTCVKFSPSTDFCLIGYGVREPVMEDPHGNQYHPVTALYRIRGGMTHVSTMLSGDDDVNIARFHPDAGYGFVYGTKQGRVRVMSPRPWNYYDC